MFKDTAVESLTLSIDLFNRPSPLARNHAVIMMLAHGFEMLLKAAIFQRTGTVRDDDDPLTFSLGKCIAKAADELQIVSTDERTLLFAIKQDRDCATHDTIAMNDDLLWVHMRAGITVFRRLLRDELGQSLEEVLPTRVIPVSAAPPSDLTLLVEQELRAIAEINTPSSRRSVEVRARLRPLLSLDGSATGRSDRPTESEVTRAERALRAGADWRNVLPGLATLQIASASPNGDGQEVVLRVGKDADSVPVRRARSGESEEALAYRGVSPFEEFGVKLTEFGDKLGITRYEGLALIDALELKSDDRSFFVQRTDRGNPIYQGLSARAVQLGRDALADDGFDLQAAVLAYNRKMRGSTAG